MRLTCKSVHFAMKTFSGKNGYSSDGILYVMGVMGDLETNTMAWISNCTAVISSSDSAIPLLLISKVSSLIL